MNVKQEKTIVISMPAAKIPKDHFLAPVTRDLQEMELVVKVSNGCKQIPTLRLRSQALADNLTGHMKN